MLQVLNELPKDSMEDSFNDVIVEFLNFYETQMSETLLFFTEKFKATIEKLTKFLSLRSKDDLPDLIASLLKFEAKHKEFTARIVEQKRVNERKKALNQNSRN